MQALFKRVNASMEMVTKSNVEVPMSHHPRPREDEEGNVKLYPPSQLLWAPMKKSSHHTVITIPELPMCRICDPDERNDDTLVELGCSCKGSMSRMHRKCILQWYGVRMLLDKNYKCDLCNTCLHPEAQLVVVRGVTDHESGGRAIVMEALKAAMAPYRPPIIDVDSSATYQELVHFLHVKNAAWLTVYRKILLHMHSNAIAVPVHHQPQRCIVALPFLLTGLAVIVLFWIVTRITHYQGCMGTLSPTGKGEGEETGLQ